MTQPYGLKKQIFQDFLSKMLFKNLAKFFQFQVPEFKTP